MRVIVALSGGLASAWCAHWAFQHYSRADIVLYFNDTKWEHPDLYRFLSDLERHFGHPITHDTDGRSPEQVCYDEKFLANDRAPFCSKILKAKRLQAFFEDGDRLVFGIGADEMPRAHRLVAAYQRVSAARGKTAHLLFPLIRNRVTRDIQLAFLASTGIALPELYRLGFTHNNCGGGCVRSGMGQWRLLYRTQRETYLARERFEEEFRAHIGKDVSFMKSRITLQELRTRIEAQGEMFTDDSTDTVAECFGVCEEQQ